MFVRVGEVAQIGPGQMRAFDVDGTPVAIANAGGAFYAFDDTCTHAGCSLADGGLEGMTVTCSCHGSEFDVRTGEVLQGPAEEPVRSRAVRIEGQDLLTEA